LQTFQERFMRRMNRTLAPCALAVALSGETVAAQQTPSPKPAANVEQKAKPSVWDQTKEMTW
jgi:hypothetical protein